MRVADQMADEIYGLHCDIGRLEAENSKLRELLLELYETAQPEAPSMFEAEFADRMRELGVECKQMTTTERLCELLDEREVEHYEHEVPAANCVAFFDGEYWHDCWESVGDEINITFSMTPEQAITATLEAEAGDAE